MPHALTGRSGVSLSTAFFKVAVSHDRRAYDADAALLDRMVRAVVDGVDPEQAILFDARNDAAAESDFDLIVVEAEPFGGGRSRNAEEVRLYRALAGYGISKDILVS